MLVRCYDRNFYQTILLYTLIAVQCLLHAACSMFEQSKVLQRPLMFCLAFLKTDCESNRGEKGMG